ncbi:hypothetical protein KC19_4G050400 [Ceratodon purpureus]|uniref:Uncharacterized protein n=1 Tax=Ceratodon purpureus TaxID=3225 RepID=A0A8T0I767_CERPU|nr:hypothetical protein KC19_4G050400 [Ceratodon purpureus]
MPLFWWHVRMAKMLSTATDGLITSKINSTQKLCNANATVSTSEKVQFNNVQRIKILLRQWGRIPGRNTSLQLRCETWMLIKNTHLDSKLQNQGKDHNCCLLGNSKGTGRIQSRKPCIYNDFWNC